MQPSISSARTGESVHGVGTRGIRHGNCMLLCDMLWAACSCLLQLTTSVVLGCCMLCCAQPVAHWKWWFLLSLSSRQPGQGGQYAVDEVGTPARHSEAGCCPECSPYYLGASPLPMLHFTQVQISLLSSSAISLLCRLCMWLRCR